MRGKIDSSQVDGRRVARASMARASSDIMCAQLFLAEPKSTCSTRAIPFSTARAICRIPYPTNRTHCARFFFVSRRRCFQDRRGLERWRKVATGPCQVIARSAEPSSHGRADDGISMSAQSMPSSERSSNIMGRLILLVTTFILSAPSPQASCT